MHPFKKMILSKTTTSEGGGELLPLDNYCYDGMYSDSDSIHYPPGGSINYEDAYGNPISITGISIEMGTTCVMSSSVPITSGVIPA